MIEYIEVTNESGSSLRLPLSNYTETGVVIRNIEGIGTVKANVNMANYFDSDTKKLNSTSLTTRNIVLTFNLYPTATESVEEVRDKLYVFFTPKKKINLVFKTDRRYAGIDGVVETNEPTIFTELEQVQISILCEDPLFYDKSGANVDVKEYELNATESLFEFPFENNSLTEKLIELGNIRHRPINAINYIGEYDTGLTINIHCTGVVIDPVIYSNRQRGTFKLITSKLSEIIEGSTRFEKGDTIMINTINGSKTIVLLRDGNLYNILHLLESGSTWPMLLTGENEFIVDAVSGYMFIKISYSYKLGYLGI